MFQTKKWWYKTFMLKKIGVNFIQILNLAGKCVKIWKFEKETLKFENFLEKPLQFKERKL